MKMVDGLVASIIIIATANIVSAVEPLKLDKPPIAHWSFDEPTGDASHAAGGHVELVAGLFGNAAKFSGRHLLHCGEKPAFGKMSKIAFSAWVMPTAFETYNEIFRKEDGEQRVLFSFQEHGRVLSLGLNINGYIECDAKIDPAQVLDGQWHHAAASFDGKTMRVYLDGREIGALERPGSIVAGGRARGCIGSSNGGECFQGAMDELRIYADALTATEVARLYNNGLDAIASREPSLRQALAEVYAPGQSFAATLAACRRNIIEKNVPLTPGLAGLIAAKLQATFPDDCDRFRNWAGVTPTQYLASKDNDFNARTAGRLMELLLEYKPLTEHQRKLQTPEQLRTWEEADKLKQRFDALVARGESARFSPEWIELMFEVGPKIQFRPHEREAVAPYVTPQTPKTRNLTTAEAREALERDWMFQADGKPTAERIRDEIKWTRELAARIRGVDFTKELAELAELEKQSGTGFQPVIGNDEHRLKTCATFFKVRELKRRIMFKNPVANFPKVLFVDMPFPAGNEWPHETRHRLGYMAVPGARLLVLDGLRPDGKLTQLAPQAPLHGSFWRPDLSFDGKKIVFCFKPHNEKSFHLYEINVDGSGLTQLTDGAFDDLDPIYLPDGHILFTTTRGHTYVRCMPPTNAYVLARCDGGGHNIYLVSANNEPDYLPSVMNDGRVLYTRWEYTDKPLWRAQKLWTINPDGTQVSMFWGNQSVWPDVMKDARSIPHSRRVMFTGSAHHGWFSGAVGIIDPDKGLNFPDGLTKVTADVTWPECGNGPVDPVESPRYHASGNYPAYYSPCPLSERDFIVSANRGGKFALYLMDTDGNRELIYEGVNNIFHALPLKPRELPPVIADRVAWPGKSEQPKHGVIFSNNIYQGAPAELRGKVKFLRVMHIDPKTYTYWNKRPYISTGPVVSAVQSEGVKRVLGTVPVEADGSVAFYAPPGKALHFQLLDANQRALQTMRSFVGVMPGEYRGCLGCHESHSRSPVVGGNSLALAKPPRSITPPPWGEDTVSYPRYVQPVLDKYCNNCHGGAGEARKVLDLTERPSGIFSEPYLTLIGRPTWGKAYKPPEKCEPGFGIAGMLMVEGYDKVDPAAYATPQPMKSLSYASRLVDLCANGKHYDVRVDDISLQRLILWVDAMCPYKGDEEVRCEPDPVFQGVEWLAIRPKISSAPRIVRPGPVE